MSLRAYSNEGAPRWLARVSVEIDPFESWKSQRGVASTGDAGTTRIIQRHGSSCRALAV
jgi:hypothetical protein